MADTDVLSQDSPLSFSPSSPITVMRVPTPLDASEAGVSPLEAEHPQRAPNPRIEEDYRKSNEAIADFRKSSAEEVQLHERHAAEGKQDQAKYRAMSDNAMLERHQAQEKLKDSRLKQGPPPQKTDANSDWLAAATMIGALAGGLTRRHTTNALAAFTGAMQGYQEGSQQKFTDNMKTWEAERKRALDTEASALSDYKEIIENQKLDMEQMSTLLQMSAQTHKDEAMAAAAKSKNSLQVAQLYDTRAKNQAAADTAHDRISQQFELTQQRFTQQQAIAQMRAIGVDPLKADDYIRGIRNYDIAPLGLKGGAIMQLVAAMPGPDDHYDSTKFFKKKSQAVGEGGALGRAGTNIELAVGSIAPVLENAADAAKQVPATAFKRINQLAQMTAEEIGDPALLNFKLANEELAVTFARVLNPRSNQVTVSMQNHARDLISTYASPEAYQRLLNNIKRISEREFEIVEERKRGEPLKPIEFPDSSQRELRPIPRQFLPKTGGTTGVTPAPTSPAGENVNPQQGLLGEPVPGTGVNWSKAAPHPPTIQERFKQLQDMLPEGWTARPSE